LLRLAALAFLLAGYLSLDWTPLRRALRSCVAFLLRALGHRTTEVGGRTDLLLDVDGHEYAFTANCTYVDLVLTLAPFCWRGRLPRGDNLRRLSALAAALLLGNVARIALALHLEAGGTPWTLAHTAPDTVVRSLAVGGCVFSAVREDWAEDDG
jgi:hypothetical protein